MDSPISSYVFANFSRAASFGILFVFSRLISFEDMAIIFLSKNVANALVLGCSFGVHISYLRDSHFSLVGASMALLSAVIVFEILFVFVVWADWSLIFFTLTAYYGLVLPSVPKERLMNIVGIFVSLIIAFIVIVYKGISLKLLFIPASCVLAIPVLYKSDFVNIRHLLRQNNVLFIGELAPFLFYM